MTRKVHIKSYGCQMNVYDSGRMADILETRGYKPADTPDEADMIILNTCHIREKAAEKVYSDIGRLRLLKERRAAEGKETLIAVAGCVAQAEGEEIMRRAPAVELVFGPQTYHRLPALLDQVREARVKGKRGRVVETDFPAEEKFDHMPTTQAAKSPMAFLTIQEGCDKFCTFCVVPYTRGAEYSRPVEKIMNDARTLAENGVREITLLGQNVNAYHGKDEKGRETSLGGLIRKLADISGLERIRYTTSHPRDMDEDLIRAHGEVEKCMPYLHLPVQSGSDKVLAAMNRKHTAAHYLNLIRKIRETRPDIAISGDFIVGFPGETDKDFEDTLSLVEKVRYAQAYSFKYSPRPGTPAAGVENQVAEEIKAERLSRLQELLNRQQQEFNRKTAGKTLDVLFEKRGKHPGQVVGRSPYMQAVHVSLGEQASGNYNRDGREVVTPEDMLGRIFKVEIISAGPNSLEGRLVKEVSARSAA